MTVKQLIDQLMQMDQHLEVMLSTPEDSYQLAEVTRRNSVLYLMA